VIASRVHNTIFNTRIEIKNDKIYDKLTLQSAFYLNAF